MTSRDSAARAASVENPNSPRISTMPPDHTRWPGPSQVRPEDRDREVLGLEGGVPALGLCLRAGAQGLTLHVISVPCSISLSGPVIHCPPFAMHKSR